jgi:hypothetical protein
MTMDNTTFDRFSESERRFLLSERGIGVIVVERLESVGLHSLEALRQVGVVHAVLLVCASVGSIGWANRRRSLERALGRSLTAGPPPPVA